MSDAIQQTTVIHCPVCQERNVLATLREIVWYLGPTGWVLGRECYARCSRCGKESMFYGVTLADVFGQTADELSTHLVGPASASAQRMAAIALLTCFLPIIGFLLARKAWKLNRNAHGLSKQASMAALIVSTPMLISGLFALILIPVLLLLKAT